MVCRKLRQKLSIVSQRAKNRTLRGCDGRQQDNTSNLSRPRAWIEINSSALSPTLMWPCPEQKGVTMGCLYLEVQGQSCLVGSVDQGLMKNRLVDLLGRMTQTRARKKHFSNMFPIATLPGIFQQLTLQNKFANFLARLSTFHCHRYYNLVVWRQSR